MPFPSPGDLPHLGIEPRSLALQVDSLPAEPPGKPTFPWQHLAKVSPFFSPWHCPLPVGTASGRQISLRPGVWGVSTLRHRWPHAAPEGAGSSGSTGAQLVGAGSGGKRDSRPTLPPSLVVTHLSKAHGSLGSSRWDLVEEERKEKCFREEGSPTTLEGPQTAGLPHPHIGLPRAPHLRFCSQSSS